MTSKQGTLAGAVRIHPKGLGFRLFDHHLIIQGSNTFVTAAGPVNLAFSSVNSPRQGTNTFIQSLESVTCHVLAIASTGSCCEASTDTSHCAGSHTCLALEHTTPVLLLLSPC
jgi:hypothetical protein